MSNDAEDEDAAAAAAGCNKWLDGDVEAELRNKYSELFNWFKCKYAAAAAAAEKLAAIWGDDWWSWVGSKGGGGGGGRDQLFLSGDDSKEL